MPEQINGAADLWVSVEADLIGADTDKDASTSGKRSTQPSLMVGTYNSTLPTVPNNKSAALQTDDRARLRVAPELVSGLSTETTLALISSKLPASLGSQSLAGSLSVVAASTSTWAATQSGSWTVNLGTIGGAATAANQATTNTSLSSIDGKLPALGQALGTGSVPVVLPAAQITALTPPSTVNLGTLGGAATAASQATIIGHVDGIETLLGTINTNTNNTAGATSTLTNTVYNEGDVDTVITGTPFFWEDAGNTLTPVSVSKPLPVTGSLTVSNTVSLAVFKATNSGTGYSTNQIIVLRQTPPAAPEYYNATTNAVISAPTPAHLGPISSSTNVIIDSGTVTGAGGTFPVTDSGGSLTVDAALNAPVAVQLSNGTTGISTLPTSLATLPADYNSGTAGSTTLRSVLATRHEAAATPLSVRLSSGSAFDPTIPVTGAFFQAIQPVTGTLTANLGTIAGVATAANQATVIGHVDGIETLLTAIDVDTSNIAVSTTLLGTAVYTEGATDSTITGIPLLWEGASNTLSTVSAAAPLPVADADAQASLDSIVAFLDAQASLSETQPVSLSTLPLDYGSGAIGSATPRFTLAAPHSNPATPLAVRITDGTDWTTGIPVSTAEPQVLGLTLTVSTAGAYAVNNTLGSMLTFTNAVPTNAGKSNLSAVTIIDLENLKPAFDLVFYTTSVASYGANRAAYAVNDTHAAECLGVVPVTAADYRDMVTHSIATVVPYDFGLLAGAGSRNIFIGTIARDVYTFTTTTPIIIKPTAVY